MTSKQLKKILSDYNEKEFPEDNVALMLSGGVDSCTVGFTCHELGKQITVFSFQLANTLNPDCEKAELICKKKGWDFIKVIVPTDDPKKDFFNLIRKHGVKKKTELEVLFPCIHVINRIKSSGFTKALTGFESWFPDNTNKSKEIKKDVNEYWKAVLNGNRKLPTDTKKVIDYGISEGVELHMPLEYNKIKQACSGKTYQEIHSPVFKGLWQNLYPDDFKKIGTWDEKSKLNLQAGARVEDYFSILTQDPIINHRGYVNGNLKQRLVSLTTLWSKNISNQQAITPYKTRYEFQPYKLDDVRNESKKELFTVVSLFAGGGGSSTGYKLAGGKILWINEFVEEAVNTYRANYPETPIVYSDIRKITRGGGRKKVLDFFSQFGIEEGGYDILDGSPPCSTFSTSGKGKEKILQKNVKYSDTSQDRIGMLIHDHVYLVNCTKPKVSIIENVKGIKKSDVYQQAMERMRRWGYKINAKVISSSNFGVPQRRERFITISIRSDVCKKAGINHENDILKLFPKESIYEPSIRDAFEGLEIDDRERRFTLTKCKKTFVYDLIKSIPKDPVQHLRLKDIDPNFTSYFNLTRASWDRPSPTLTQAGQQIGVCGVHHPSEDRVFTINELKRLFGLPDDYKLTGSFNQKAERVCRMVTPHIYKYLAKEIYDKVLSC